MNTVSRSVVKSINSSQEMLQLNRIHQSETAASLAFGNLVEAAGNLGVSILPCVGMPRTLDTGTMVYEHETEMGGVRSENMLIRQVYVFDTGRTEVTAYLS